MRQATRVITVQTWSGREARALREARRMTLAAFAAHLGVTPRMVSKWEEAGNKIVPRPVNQAALDRSLESSDPDAQERFAAATSLLERRGAGNGPAGQVHHRIDGKPMVRVEAGEFLGGADNQLVWLARFYVDVYPTTNADYARFTAATGHRPPQHWPGGRCPDTLFDHPVVHVSWHDAAAYAAWANKSLPDATQWEKAARGTHGAIYPWGRSPTPAKCNTRESGIGASTPVDCYHSGASPYGVYDLCGNVWEWCSTPSAPDRRELKGSAFTSPFERATPSAFNDAPIAMHDDDTGFRCAASIGQMYAAVAA